MSENPPPIPDGPGSDASFFRWARDQIISLGRTQDVANVGMSRTTRGTAIIPTGGSSVAAITSRLDQAVFAKGNGETIDDGHGHTYTNNRKQVYGVAAGYIYALSSNGTITKSKRFAFGWGDATLVYDSAHDKLIVSFWNEQRGDDSGAVENGGSDGSVSGNTLTSATGLWDSSMIGRFVIIGTELRTITAVASIGSLTFDGSAIGTASNQNWTVVDIQKGLYKINPDDLTTELFSPLVNPPTSGFNPFTENTSLIDGPHQIVIRKNPSDATDVKLYVLYWGRPASGSGSDSDARLLKIHPVTFAVIAASPAAQGEGSPFCDLAIDETNGLIWETDSQGQELVNMDLATFSTQHGIDLAPKLTTPGTGTADLDLDLSTTVQNYGSGAYSNGLYVTAYKQGVCQDLGFATFKYFVTLIGTQFVNQTFNGVVGGSDQSMGSGILFATQAAAKADALANSLSSVAWLGADATLGVRPTGYCDQQWDAGTLFLTNKLIQSGDIIWRCITDNTNFDPNTATAWNVSTAYHAGDKALQNGIVFKAIDDNTGVNPQTGAYWETTSIPTTGITTWDSTHEYHPGDLVERHGVVYRCLNTNTNQDPDGGGIIALSHWAQIWQMWIKVVEPYKLSLTQVTKYLGVAPPFAPYGICCVPKLNLLYLTRRNCKLGFYNVANAGVVGSIDLNRKNDSTDAFDTLDTAAFPYRCRFNSNDKLVYVPGYRSNRIYVVDPAQNKVIGTVENIEACFDVIFEPSPGARKWAVCHGVKGLVPFSFTRPS